MDCPARTSQCPATDKLLMRCVEPKPRGTRAQCPMEVSLLKRLLLALALCGGPLASAPEKATAANFGVTAALPGTLDTSVVEVCWHRHHRHRHHWRRHRYHHHWNYRHRRRH